MDAATNAFVISASLMKGCYRHIKISADAPLEQLGDVIIGAFYFDNDHAHAFFMDNRAWSDADCYYMDMDGMDDSEEELRYTSEYTLRQVGLTKGQNFLFIFDFGEEWRFQCGVLKELEDSVDAPEVTRVVGTPPRQYA